MTRLSTRPFFHLTRHFFGGLFDFGFLSEAGAASFTRLVIGICATFLSFGLLLVRIFMAKYAELHGAGPDAYRQAVVADHAFLVAIPMWIVAFVAVLEGHALFPDETDFRVLMPLPVTRRFVFGAKTLALVAFIGLFVASVHVALAPLFGLMAFGPATGHGLLVRAAAYEVASLTASVCAFLAIAAIQGLFVMYAPRGRQLVFSTVLRSMLLCVLVLALPLIARLPTAAAAFEIGAWWLLLAPPAWFVGLEQWMLGDGRPHVVSLATAALGAVMLASGVAAASYAVLYRRFERVLRRPADGPGDPRRARARSLRARPVLRRPVFVAIRAFAMVTLRRSVLHQGIFVVLAALGVGLVLNSLMKATPGRALRGAVVWAPFALMFVTCFAVRTSLMVPMELRANWVFRMNEQDIAKPDQLKAGISVMRWLGVVLPVAALFPLQWGVFGPDLVAPLTIALLGGALLVEILMKDWARVPFTCSYLPGKGFVPQTILLGLLSFVVFTVLGQALTMVSLLGGKAFLVPTLLLAGAVGLMHVRRVRAWQHTVLAYEDELPTEANPLKLH